jgi:hypothetical protein
VNYLLSSLCRIFKNHENVEVNCLGAAFEPKLFGKDKNANPCVSLHATFLKIRLFVVTNDEVNFSNSPLPLFRPTFPVSRNSFTGRSRFLGNNL